jgi:hypothetical protein
VAFEMIADLNKGLIKVKVERIRWVWDIVPIVKRTVLSEKSISESEMVKNVDLNFA